MWTRDARMEHASIASFSRLALELMAVGAPAELVERAHHAALDEARHARICFEQAQRHAGAEIGPGALPLDGLTLANDLEELAVATVIDGCVGETLAAALLRERAACCTDPALSAVLERMAEDEAEHAAFAYAIVGWAITSAPQIATAVHAAFDRGLRDFSAEPVPFDGAVLSAHGFLDEQSQRHVMRAVARDAIQPLRDMLVRIHS